LRRKFFVFFIASMRPRSPASLFALATLALSGCGYVHIGRMPAPVVGTTVVGDEKLLKENADLRLEKKMLQQELALTRAQGEALRMAIENRAADGDTSHRLTEKLNETTRELAALRASYAQLTTERDRAIASAADATNLQTKLGAAEDKLAESLRAYTGLQSEITRLRSDVEQSRAENVALTSQLATASARSEQAQAALAAINTELLAQKEARQHAEQDAAMLRSELKSSGSALAQLRAGSATDARSLNAEVAAENAALLQQLGALREKVGALETERDQLRQQLAAATRPDLANLEARLADALDQLKTARSDLSTTTAAKTALEGRLAQLKSGAASSETQSLRAQLQQAQAQASALTEENAQLKSRLAGTGAPAPAPVTPPPSGVNATLVATVPGTIVVPKANNIRIDLGASTRFHIVAGGDTLAKISQQYYGTPARWGDILAANRDVLGENNNLVIGRTLRIP